VIAPKSIDRYAQIFICGHDGNERWSIYTDLHVTVMPVKRRRRAFGRSAHQASQRAQIEAGVIRLEKQEDHRSFAVRAKRTLAGRFASEKRRNGMIEHSAFPLISAGTQHSQSPIGAGMVMTEHDVSDRDSLINPAHF
jgi:hypothetical protein